MTNLLREKTKEDSEKFRVIDDTPEFVDQEYVIDSEGQLIPKKQAQQIEQEIEELVNKIEVLSEDEQNNLLREAGIVEFAIESGRYLLHSEAFQKLLFYTTVAIITFGIQIHTVDMMYQKEGVFKLAHIIGVLFNLFFYLPTSDKYQRETLSKLEEGVNFQIESRRLERLLERPIRPEDNAVFAAALELIRKKKSSPSLNDPMIVPVSNVAIPLQFKNEEKRVTQTASRLENESITTSGDISMDLQTYPDESLRAKK